MWNVQKNIKKGMPTAAVTYLATIILGLGLMSCSRGGDPGKPEPLTIGKMPIEAHALIMVAEERGFFAENGVRATIRDYETGPAALKALLNSEVDLSMSGEYAVVGSAFRKENVSVIASIDRYMYFHLAGRKDRGIKTIADLKGKRVSVARGTNAEFFLGRLLNLNGIGLQEATLVNVQPDKLDDAIVDGAVDAAIFLRQYGDTIRDGLGANGIFWPAQSGQPLYSLMLCRKDWAVRRPETVRRVLRSLYQAEKYLVSHPSEAMAIVQKKLKYPDDYMATLWRENQFSLSLDRSLIAAMEDEARWMIGNVLADEKQIPNLLDFIYEDGLKAVKPQAVSIIR